MFWVLLLILFYSTCGYGLLLVLLGFFKRYSPPLTAAGSFPDVTLVIAAYNEEKIIAEKIENSLQLDYAEDKLEIIVFSDGSTDNTDKIVMGYAARGVKLLRIDGRRGKTHCKNEAAKIARGEIIVFSDANSIYEPDSFRRLFYHFADPAVGCVSGELRYLADKGVVKGEALYWTYEQHIKRLESAIGALTTANGAIYALRRSAWQPLPEKVTDDFAAALSARQKGFRVLYEPRAVAREYTAPSTHMEYQRRLRMVRRAAYSLLREPSLRRLLNPFKHGFFSIQLWSHKILRWLTGAILLALFVLNICLLRQGPFYILTAVCQMIFYALAFCGYLWEEKLNLKTPRAFHLPYYLLLSFTASLQGFYHALQGKTEVSWKPHRS